MKTIDLSRRKADLASILRLAAKEPVLITSAGQEFLVSRADDFDAEVAVLRQSARFQALLGKRQKSRRRIPLAEIEEEIAAALRAGEK
jgi:hypothetical protein